MRGRRVALLLTGLWPLLAKDDVPATENNVTIEDFEQNANTNENNALPSEDDALQQLPKLPLNTLLTSNPSNIVMVEPIFDDGDLLDDLVEIDDEEEIIEHEHDSPVDVETTFNDETLDDTRQLHKEEPIVEEVEQIQNQQADEEAPKDLPAASRNEPETNAPKVNENDNESSSPEPTDNEDSTVSETETESSTNETEDQESLTEESESPQVQDGDDNETSVKEATSKDDASSEEDEEDEEENVTDRVLVDYASKSAGALILEKSPAMKGTSNLLNGDNDKYAIVPCSEKKFVVINLSEDILVKQVKLSNYERYSSQLKDFQILGSQTMGEWVDLGTYTAEMGNGEQAFDLEEPEWARYLKFRFLTHYGSEHYCTYSQIKVHGSTMLQGFHEQWDSQEDSEDGSQEGEVEAESAETGGEGAKVASDIGDDTTKEGESSSKAKTDESEDQGKGDESRDESPEAADDSPSETGATRDVTDDASGDEPSKDDEANDTTTKATDREEVVSEDGSPSSADTDDKGTIDAERETGKTSSGVNEQDSECQTPCLSTASVPVSSHDAAVVSERNGSTEQLNTSAMKPVEQSLKEVVSSVVKEMVAAEAFMSLKDAQSVSDEVKDIQESLKMIAMPGADKVETNADDTEESDSTPIETTDTGTAEKSEATTTTASADTPDENEAASGSESDGGTSVGKDVNNEGADDKSLEGSSSTKDDSQDSVADESLPQKDETTESPEKTSQAIDPALGDIIARFPSAACLSNLDFQDFKAKIVASRANAQGGQPPGHGGKMEPIFKLLTAEIKGLQMSQSVQDQYMKALISCYQQVMLEMANALSKVETQQEKRLSDLEQAMDAARSGVFKRVFAAIATVISTCILGAQLAYHAIASSLDTLVALGLVDDMTTALLVLGVCSLALLTIGYCICAVCSQPSAKKKVETDNGPSAKRTETIEQVSSDAPEKATPPTELVKLSVPVAPVQPDIVESENESDKSDIATGPAIALAPRAEKRQTATTFDPNLIPVE